MLPVGVGTTSVLRGDLNRAPLEGIRVVDLSRVFAMPYCGTYLADLGAEVIKVETHHSQFVDTTRTLNGPYPGNEPGDNFWERGGTFQTLNRGKRSVTLDLRSEEALEVLKDLVSISDVVLENFTPRVMRRFGLDYARLKAHRPDLIMVSNTGYGHSGPWQDFGAMATALEPTHGTGAFMGYLEPDGEGRLQPGSAPNKIANSYTDFLASWTAQLAVLACLFHRANTGQGAWIDLAMYQVGVSYMGEGLLDFAFNGRQTRRLGNRHEFLSPHGCYPCRGDDEWVVVAARDDAEWKAVCRVIGRPDLTEDVKFADPVIRHSHQDEMDEIIAGWTATLGQYQVMELLQAEGVPAGPALDGKGIWTNSHLRRRGYFETVEHPPETGLGQREYTSRGWKLRDSKVGIGKPGPTLGQDNHYVLSEMLGVDSARVDGLKKADTIGDTLKGASVPRAVPMERQVELGWTVRYDPDYQDSVTP